MRLKRILSGSIFSFIFGVIPKFLLPVLSLVTTSESDSPSVTLFFFSCFHAAIHTLNHQFGSKLPGFACGRFL